MRVYALVIPCYLVSSPCAIPPLPPLLSLILYVTHIHVAIVLASLRRPCWPQFPCRPWERGELTHSLTYLLPYLIVMIVMVKVTVAVVLMVMGVTMVGANTHTTIGHTHAYTPAP